MAQAEPLADGGMVVVLLGKDYDCPSEYRYHPQVQVIDSTRVEPTGVSKMIPANARIAIVTNQIPPPVFAAFKSYASRRKLLYLPRSSAAALKDELAKQLAANPVVDQAPTPKPVAKVGDVVSIVPAKEKEGRKIAPKGTVPALLDEAKLDLSKGVAEEARRIADFAKTRGIQTTLGSIEQAIRVRKRKAGRGDIPLSVVPTSERLGALAMLDHAIDGLNSLRDNLEKLRDYVRRVDEESERKERQIENFSAKMELLEEAFKGLRE